MKDLITAKLKFWSKVYVVTKPNTACSCAWWKSNEKTPCPKHGQGSPAYDVVVYSPTRKK